MKKHLSFIFSLILLGMMGLNVVAIEKTVHVSTPGTLKALLGSDISKITNLTVSGHLNAADCAVLGRFGSKWPSLDISKATLPNNTIYYAMFYANQFRKIVLPDNLEVIEKSAFEEGWIEEPLVLPAGLKKIGLNAFYFFVPMDKPNQKTVLVDFTLCKNSLTSLPSTLSVSEGDVVNYGVFDFSDFPKLEPIRGMFEANYSITKVVFPTHFQHLPYLALSGSTAAIVVLPSSIKKLENFVLSGASVGQLIVHSPTPPTLGQYVFDGAKISAIHVPEASVAKYKAAAGWSAFASKIKPMISDTVQIKYISRYDPGYPNSIPTEETYTGVRVGEYYWMNKNFNNLPIDAKGKLEPIKKEDINLLHQRYNMFEYNTCSNDRNNYWDYYRVTVEDINNYFGQYISRHEALDWMTKVQMKEREFDCEDNKVVYKDSSTWRLPSCAAARQLVSMCGYGTPPEFSQYAGFKYDSNKLQPSFVTSAFFTEDRNFGDYFLTTHGKNYKTNGYKKENNNKYGMNMVPAGVRFHEKGGKLLTTTCAGEVNKIPADRGDLNGFEQTYQLRLKDGGGYKLSINDHSTIDYGEDEYGNLFAQHEYQPVRWCRELTDEELGYKIFIDQPDFTDSYTSLRTLVNKLDNNEFFDIRIKPVHFTVEKNMGSRYIELPKGYLRGFIVQFIMEEANPSKTIEELIRIAYENPRLWPSRQWGAAARSALKIETILDQPEQEVKVSADGNILRIENIDLVESISVQSVLNSILVNNLQMSESIDLSHLPAGVYVVNIKTANKVYSEKIFIK